MRLPPLARACAPYLTVLCAAHAHAQLARSDAPLVYGHDERAELGDEHPAWVGAAARHLLAIGLEREVLPAGERVLLASPTAQERLGLCADEPFAQEPSFALCSAVLLTGSLALTAAHCTEAAPMDQLVALSGFQWDATGGLVPLSSSAVHSLETVHVDYGWDVAFVRIDPPLDVESLEYDAPLTEDTPLVSIDHGIGLPAKVHGGARAYHVDDSTFLSDLDVFGGASGAPVFTATGQLLGVLSAGSPDYVPTPGGCLRAVRVEAGRDHANELVIRTNTAVESLCQAHDDPELCPAQRAPSGCTASGRTHRFPALEAAVIALGLVYRKRRPRGRRARRVCRPARRSSACVPQADWHLTPG